MATRRGGAIPVWYSDQDRERLEEAAALAGYRHLSKYIRDRSLGRGAYQDAGGDPLEAWAHHQEVSGRLTELAHAQQLSQAMLAMLLFLVRCRASTGEVSSLRASVVSQGGDALAALPAELAMLLQDLMENS